MRDRNADVHAVFERGPAPAGPERGGPNTDAAVDRQPRHYEASLRSAERFKVVVRDAKTRHPRLPGYLCTLHRPGG